MVKEATKISINISKRLEKEIIKDVEHGSFTDTKTSVIVKILEEYYKKRLEED